MNQSPQYGIQLTGRYVGITNPGELNEVSDWLLDFVDYRGWLVCGSPEHSMLYRDGVDVTLEGLKHFERLFRNRWPLFDGTISLQDLNACTLEEWDQIQVLLRQINQQ